MSKAISQTSCIKHACVIRDITPHAYTIDVSVAFDSAIWETTHIFVINLITDVIRDAC